MHDSKSLSSQIAASPIPNLQLNWLLMAYLYPNTSPGAVADRVTADATLWTLRERAMYFARRKGACDPDLGDEALCSMLAWVATSRMAERFQVERGTPRRFIDKILANFVALEIRKKWRSSAGPLPESIARNVPSPADEAEVNELISLCGKRLGIDAASEFVKGSPDDAPAQSYLRKHRERKRKWECISDLFPDVAFRPARRRQGK
jgi:hypothetical protein